MTQAILYTLSKTGAMKAWTFTLCDETDFLIEAFNEYANANELASVSILLV